MSKKYLGLGALVLILLAIGFIAFNKFNVNRSNSDLLTNTSPTPPATAEPRATAKAENIADEIKIQLVAKHGSSAQKLDVAITKVEGDYAKGSANVIGEGGGMWFAAKVNGAWKLVWDGNGIITCDDLSSYPDFPAGMIPQCFDAATGNMKTR